MSGDYPPCFGKLWDPRNNECKGGNDPSYVNPRTGTNKRDMCRFYSACSGATNQNRLNDATQGPQPPPVIPASRLGQKFPAPPPPAPSAPTPGAIPPPPPIPPPAPQQQTVPQAQVMSPQQPMAQQQVTYMGQMPWTQPGYAGQPALVPMNQPMPGAAVPSFLTVPEPVNPDVPFMTRFARTMWRSACKATAIGAANFIDYNPITPEKK